MINLTHRDIRNFEYIGHGGFGNVYRNGKYIYKLYRNDGETINPSLLYRPLKFKRLISVDKDIRYTDLIKDTVSVDGKFAGVMALFYDGSLLMDLCHLNFGKRLDISYQIVRNSKELTDHFIYPTDYKLDNIMYVNDKVKLIDLDDCLTSVGMMLHSFKLRRCVKNLDLTIKSFLDEYSCYPLFPDIKVLVDKKSSIINYTYQGIYDYLSEKSKVSNYIFISKNSDLYSNIRLLRDCRNRIVYFSHSYCFKEELLNTIINIKDMGISIYDVIPCMDIGRYLDNKLYGDVLELRGNNLVKFIH